MRDGIMVGTSAANDAAVQQRIKENAARGYGQQAETGCHAQVSCNEPLIVRLEREASSYGEQAARKQRAIELLLIHPEFEDLIELLRLVNIY